MALRIRDIVDRQIFAGAALAAGKHVDNLVQWVNVMEILDMPRSMNAGELVVSTGYGLEDQTAHKDLIHQMKIRGVSGLAIQPGYYIDQIPAYIIEDADREEFPIIELPERLSFSEILHVLMDQIADSSRLMGKLEGSLLQLKKSLEKEIQGFFGAHSGTYLFLVSLTAKSSGDAGRLRDGIGKIRSFLNAASLHCCQTTVPGGIAAFLVEMANGDAFTEAIYDLSISLTFLSEQEEVNFYVGVEQVEEISALGRAFQSTYDHVRLLDHIGAKRGICTFENRLLVELLGSLHQNDTSIVLGNRALQLLLDYDRYNHTGYVHTVRIFLAHNCNFTKTAEHLFIHRHTLMKRMQNISNLCSINFSDYYMRVYMSLAILIHDYFAY